MEISDDRKRYSSIRGHKSNQSESYDFLSADQLSEGVKYEDFGFGVKITHNSFNNISLLKQEVLTRKSQQEQREKEILEFYKFEPSKEEI